MDPGSRLVAIGLAVVFAAVVAEYFRYHLSGLAVGFGLVVLGFLLMMSNAVGSEEGTGRSERQG